LTYVVDLYAGDLHESPTAVSLDDAYMDKSGYYALARKDAQNEFEERQLDFYGGLRWRFEEHVPALRRRIDQISIFAPNLVCVCGRITRSMIQNTIHMHVRGITALLLPSCHFEQQKR
jgi:hypothetical protein